MEQYTDAELQIELERRKLEAREKNKPQPAGDPDWSRVLPVVQEYIYLLHAGERIDLSDTEHAIFEAAVEAVYGGREVWKWIRKHQR